MEEEVEQDSHEFTTTCFVSFVFLLTAVFFHCVGVLNSLLVLFVVRSSHSSHGMEKILVIGITLFAQLLMDVNRLAPGRYQWSRQGGFTWGMKILH